MAISRVPGSRKSLKLLGHANLQSRRKRVSNPQLELLDDRVPPNNFLDIATAATLPAILSTGGRTERLDGFQESANKALKPAAMAGTASEPIAAVQAAHRSAGQHSRNLTQAAATHRHRLAPTHLTSRATHHPLAPKGSQSKHTTQPSQGTHAAASAPTVGTGSHSASTNPTNSTPPPNTPLATPPTSALGGTSPGAPTTPPAGSSAPVNTGPKSTVIAPSGSNATLNQIDHFVVIYQENWSFDSLYGKFPGANGIANSFDANGNFLETQIDRITGQPISTTGPTFNPAYSYDPATLNNPPQPLDANNKVDTRFPAGLNTLHPYNLSNYISPSDKTGDVVHRFWQEQSQIDGGKQDKYVTWSDNPGLAMSYFDATNLPEGQLAQQYTMDDNFFHSAYGGSFLNHQFLVAAAAPVYPNAPSSLQPTLDASGQLALDASGKIIQDGKITPIGAPSPVAPGQTFDQNYAVNTIYSANLAPAGTSPTSNGLLPSQNDSNPSDPSRPYIPTIGDSLDSAGVSWKWYSGGWDNALASSPTNPANNGQTPANPPVDPLFQWHHQPLAYYDNFAPWTKDPNTGQTVRNPLSAAHLQDENNFFTDVSSGNLPAVSFIKPVGPDNEHPGYTDLVTGQQHVADIVNAVQNSPEWAHTAIIITYDENGGRWDHVSPPKLGDGTWGDGTRVPAIVISPLAKKGYVDHEQYDTLSILKTIEERFNLPSLNSLDASASDLTNDFLPAQPRATGPDQHVLLLSVDGLHQADVTDPSLAPDLTNILALQKGGVSYTSASTSKPSDSFPGTLAYLTGAAPKTTGVYYDDSYSRALYPPGTTDPRKATPGTEVQYAENIDRNSNLISGGGNFDASSIDPTKLPVDSKGRPVYPSDFLKVNTIFGVASAAGLYTAFSDKHPAYEIANGPGGNSISDLYAPEVNAYAALGVVDPKTSKVTKTVNADALLAADPFTDVSQYVLVDPLTDPLNVDSSGKPIVDDPSKFTDPNLKTITNNVLLTERYDDLKVKAILNEIQGKTSQGNNFAPVPNLFGMNFQAVSVAQKYAFGGIISLQGGASASSQILEAAMKHTDASIGQIASALQNTSDGRTGSLWDSTDLIVTAKHGQDPRVGVGGLMADSTLPDLLDKAGTPVAQATQDDISLLYLQNPNQTDAAAAALEKFLNTETLNVYQQGTKFTLPASQVIDKVLWGPSLIAAGYGDPSKDATTPNIIVTLKPGFIWVGNPSKFTYKRAEHGGVNEDDTHVPLIVSGGALPGELRGTSVDTPVQTKQIAVSAMNMLGLSADSLQGVVLEKTQGLPGLHVAQDQTVTFVVKQNDQGMVGAFYDPSTTDDPNKYKVTVQWGDGLGDQNAVLIPDPGNSNIVDVWDRHTYDNTGIYSGTVILTPPTGDTITESFTARVLDNLTATGQTLSVNANQAYNLQTVATIGAQSLSASPGDYTARIDWGDGYFSNGVVVASSTPGTFEVRGSHTYVGHQSTIYPITVYITDKLGSETTANGEADVTFVAPPPTNSGTTPAPNLPGTPAGPQTNPPPDSITPQGWHVSPAGTQTLLGDRPFGIALSPDGKYLAVTNNGASTQSIMIVDRASSKVVQEIDYNGPQGVYVGIAYSPDGSKLYASAGGTVYNQDGTPDQSKAQNGPFNGVRVYNVDSGSGKLTETSPILIPRLTGAGGNAINLFTAGLTLSADGKTLYVADNLGSALSVVDLSSSAATTGGAATTIQVGPNPYTVALSHDGKTAYVSNQGGLTVSVVDLTQHVLAESDRIQVGTHPNAMALNPVNDELYVANADSDTISVIDTGSDVVVRTIDLSPYPGAIQGSSPDALTVSPDGKTLYVANAANNDVAVIALGTAQGQDKVQGLIPTAWYPTALLLSDNGTELDVLNAKGLGAGPNTGGPNPYKNGGYSPENQYIATMIKGTLSQIAVPDATQLATYTSKVEANNGFNEGDKIRVSGPVNTNVIPLHPGDQSPIKHVIYVIKENRTYDQEFGSLGKGNGDPALNLFGDESAPNARALEKQFVTLDNFYSDAEVSADGWNWSTGALANSYVQHAWPQNYGGQNRPYDFEGGNLATSPGTDPTDAFIWNKLSDAGINYRNYGFRVFNGVVAGGTEPRLAANTDPNFAGYNLKMPDSIPDLIQTGVNQPTRIAEWLKEFNQYEANGTLPTVEFVRLPNDHTATDTKGSPTPRAYVADNDYALGQLVQAVSNSKDWGSTAIFVIEDDAQEGPDHVDAHRTVAQVISPYTQTGNVDSTFYSQVSVLRTIEQIVGIAPMTQFDAAATPMLNSFTDTPNMTAYTAIVPTQDVHEKNPVSPPTPTFSPFASLNEIANEVDWGEAQENNGIWASIKGYNNQMPAPTDSGLHLDDPNNPSAPDSSDHNGQSGQGS
jgi:acid phosphatase